jgi:hypothetical protein
MQTSTPYQMHHSIMLSVAGGAVAHRLRSAAGQMSSGQMGVADRHVMQDSMCCQGSVSAWAEEDCALWWLDARFRENRDVPILQLLFVTSCSESWEGRPD